MMNMQDFKIEKKGRVYYLTDPEHADETYKVQKPNGKIVCNCPDFRNAPPGTCDHIEALREHAQAQGPEPTAEVGGADFGPEPQPPASEGPELPEVEKDQKAWWLEFAFRPDQVRIRKQDGMRYIDGASVIQRVNDVLGPDGWSFKLLGEPQQLADEVIVRGQLEARIGDRWTVREDFGAHPYTRTKGSTEPHSRGDTVKAAVTDCIKRCSRQLGVGLELYCDDDSYHSFHRILKQRRTRSLAPGTLSLLPVQPTDPNFQPEGRLQ